jgi:hypothetical protein
VSIALDQGIDQMEASHGARQLGGMEIGIDPHGGSISMSTAVETAQDSDEDLSLFMALADLLQSKQSGMAGGTSLQPGQQICVSENLGSHGNRGGAGDE